MRLEQIKARIAEIPLEMEKEGITTEEYTKLKEEAAKLVEEKRQLEKEIEERNKNLSDVAGGAGMPIGNVNIPVQPVQDERTRRAESFAKTSKMQVDAIETRSILLSGGTIATPTKVSGINDLPGGVCSILDMVTVEDCTGMSADKVAYVSAESSAASTTEGSASTTSEPTFAYLTISPADYSLVSYVSKQIRRQSPLNYTDKVQAAAFKALRKKAAEVVTAAATSSTIADELIMSQIGADTLRKIVLNYGPVDEVDAGGVLFLNKIDLIASGDVRGTNEKKPVYEIIPSETNPNVGIIQDGNLAVTYCINPYCYNLTGGTNASTTETKPTMFYGVPSTIKLDLFGSYEISVSEDYKFAEGLLAVRGEEMIGAALCVKGGVIKVSLAKAQ
jgi:hypothetical protein